MISALSAITLLAAVGDGSRVGGVAGFELGVGYTPSAPVEAPFSLIAGAEILLAELKDSYFGLELLGRATFSGRRSIALEPLASAFLLASSGVVVSAGGGASLGTDHLLTVGPTFLASVGWWPFRLVATLRLFEARPLVALSARVDLAALFVGARGMLTGYR